MMMQMVVAVIAIKTGVLVGMMFLIVKVVVNLIMLMRKLSKPG